jgi:hypothetical protein
MAQYASSSTSAHTVVATNKLSVPIGTNLLNPSTRTLAPSLGALAYDITSNLIYCGGNADVWNVVGGGTAGYTGLPGDNGATGSTGIMGQPGSTGIQGSTGSIPSTITNLTVTNLNSTNASINNLTIPSFNPAGVVHNDASGLFTSSLIVNNDILSGANITDNKLSTIFTAGKVANSATTATNSDTPSTIVARDALGNFSAGNISANLIGNVTGSASNNMLKAGDSMSGTLNMLTQNEVRFQDASGGQYVGINAQPIIPSSYTLSLPTTIPTSNQIIRANNIVPTNLEWITQGGSIAPTSSKTIYITKYGNDITGDGSFDTPYASMSKAIDVANSLANPFNPINIIISAGIYIENNSSGPLIITAQGISILGYSADTTTIIPATLSNTLLLATQSTQISNLRFLANGVSTAIGISLTMGTLASLNNIQVFNFNIGVSCSGISNTYIFNDCLFSANIIGIDVNDTAIAFNNCTVIGAANFIVPANTGISVTGANTTCIIDGGTYVLCETGILLQNNSNTTANAITFKLNVFDVVQTSSAQSTFTSCTFELTAGSTDIDMQVSGAGTSTILIGCEFNGKSSLGLPAATGIFVTDSGSIALSATRIKNYTTGIKIGDISDTSSTILTASAITIRECITDILQQGTTSLNYNSGIASGSKININDPTNISLAYFDLDKNNALSIGSTGDVNTELIHVVVGSSDPPLIEYLSSLYSTQGIGFSNPLTNPSSSFIISKDDANTTTVTTNRTNIAGLRLTSDTGSPVGGTSALRGWDINKNGSTAELSFKYQNSDAVGQAVIPQYTVAQFDGVNNMFELPTTGTKLIFVDANIYRSAASMLKTDGNFIVGGLTSNRVVVTDAITNQLSSSVVTTTEASYLSGVTSAVQTQLNNKVTRSGDTMTGTLQLPAGTTSLPSLIFTGSTTSGLSATGGNLSLSTNAIERVNISSGGIVSIDGFTSAGIVHNNTSGNLSSSSIVNSDIDSAASIVDTKLATISTAGKVANSATTATNLNNVDAIVSRDPSGNFSAGVVSASLIGNVTGSASLNLPLTGGVLTGSLRLPAGSNASPSLLFNGSTNTGISASTPNTLSFDANGVEIVNIDSSGITVDAFNVAGVVHNNALGLLSTSLVTNADITDATISNSKLVAISDLNIPGDIVVRDGLGNFSTNEITITGTVTNPTDVATKAYVDAAVSTGLVVHTPAIAVSLINQTLSGFPTIDGVTFPSETNRVLLTGQTNPIQNGLWVVSTGAWSRPADFSTGTTAGEAYVLILSGTTETGSAWLCSTPSAIIDTDSISFQLFSLPDTTTGANVGAGTGQVFQSKSGVTFNFRTLLQGDAHAVITTGSDTVSVGTDATNINTSSTIVARDGSGNFNATTITANLTGSASNNVLKAGDSMSGMLNMLTQNEVRFQDASGGQYVGINAQNIIPSSYTLSLPTIIPTSNQTLHADAVTPTNLVWTTDGGSVIPTNSEMIYVTKYGNDVTGNGSFNSPYASLSQAISVANGISSTFNPICILISTGIYIEDNSTGSLTITAQGIAIVGYSADSTIIIPNTLSNDLLLATQSIQISNIGFLASGVSTATGVSLAIGTFSSFNNIRTFYFNIGVLCSGGSSSTYVFNNSLFVGNTTALNISDSAVQCNNCSIIGSTLLVTPANTGVYVTGANGTCIISGGTVALCTTGFSLQTNSKTTADAVNFKFNTFDIVQTSASQSIISSCSFEIATGSSDIEIQASGTGTLATIVGCGFDGKDALGTPQATAIIVSDNASVQISGGQLKNYTTGFHVGLSTDTSSTIFSASSFKISNCSVDILQEGFSTLTFTTGIASSNKITINSPTNVSLAYFDLNNNNSLTIGSTADMDTNLINLATTTSNQPSIDYKSALYGTQAMGFVNGISSPSTWFATSDQNTITTTITTDRTKIAGLRLVSDTNSPIGTTTALRGWDINKNASSAELSFKYQNSDAVGQAIISQYEVMRLDGVNNQLNLPTIGTKIVLVDANIYRSVASTLKTDGNFIVGGLTSNRVVVTDAITNQLSSSVVTTTEASYLSGVTSAVQTQLNNKVTRSGDTMTGTLQLPAGSAISPSLIFTGSITTGLSANTNNLSLSTNGLERMAISSGGTVSINGFATAGVVHNDASGNLSSSLIVNSDIDPAASIVDTKLATISTAGKVANSATTAINTSTANTIVLRDSSSNFSANIITATLNGSATSFSGSLLGDVTGTQSSTVVSFIGGQSATNVAAATVLANNATNVNTSDAIVKRDGSGNFSAGTITATLNGSATNFSGSLLGDVTGTQSSTVVSLVGGQSSTNVAAATVLANSATSSNISNSIVRRGASGNFSAGAINITDVTISNTVTVTPFGTSGILHNDATGLLSTSLIVNVDISASAAIVDTKLATISTVGKVSNSATTAINTSTPSTIVLRDSSSNFSANIITATLNGSATSFSGSLVGDVTGTQSSTVVSLVGGQSSTNVAAAAVLANNATNINTINTIVKRDPSGNFSAGTITASLTGASSLNVLKAGDTMSGSLTLAAGSAAVSSLQFTGSTNTGISAGTANTLSFNTSGVQRMSMNTSTINTSLPLVIGTLFANTSSQSMTVTANGQSIAVASTTSILILSTTASRNGFTVTFPGTPTNGQYFTIMTTASGFSIAITNNGNGATVVNGITSLDAGAAPSISTGGASVTYLYNTAANSWYRIYRG